MQNRKKCGLEQYVRILNESAQAHRPNELRLFNVYALCAELIDDEVIEKREASLLAIFSRQKFRGQCHYKYLTTSQRKHLFINVHLLTWSVLSYVFNQKQMPNLIDSCRSTPKARP